MSGKHHKSHRGRRRRNPLKRLIDRFSGGKKHLEHRTTSFPGIHLPEDHSSEIQQKHTEKEITQSQELITGKGLPEGSTTPDSLKGFKPGKFRREKKSIFESFYHYRKVRAFKKEERKKERHRRKAKRRHEKEHKKREAGPSVAHKLFSWTEDGEQAPAKKKLAIFSKNSSLYRNMTIMVNSSFIFISTYIIAYLFYWITCLLIASWYGLDSILYFYDLKFNDHSGLWNRFNILLVTGIPPFMCLFAALFLHRVLFKKSRFTGLQKLFILWLAFHLFNHFFGAFPSGIVTDEGFGYVAAWLYMNTAFKFLFSLVSLFLLGLIGYLSAEYILETADSHNRIRSENQVAFMLTQIMIPWFIGTILLFLIRIPYNFDYPYETLMLFSLVFMLIPPFFNKKVKPKLNLLKVKKKRNFNIGYLITMLFLLAFLRIMLGIGLHFVIKLEISISPAFT